LLRGTMTRHSFIAYRDDHLGECQPITFEGDAWRGYVPVRLPWTLCVRDRVPAGSVAVLINRAHTYPDLALSHRLGSGTGLRRNRRQPIDH